MPYTLILIGLVLIVTGIRNTYAQLGAQLKTDFTGQQNFITWVVAIGAVGAAGYVKELQTPSRLFMGIILIALMLSNKGFIAQFQQALQQGPATITPPADAANGTFGSATGAPQANTVQQQQSGAFGQTPSSPGQATANGWINYLLGGGWLK